MSTIRSASRLAAKRTGIISHGGAGSIGRHFSGFQSPTSRGMGKEGGGKGDGGSHRAPKGGAGAPPAKGGAFAEFRARRVAALERDLEAAKAAASAEQTGKGAGISGFGSKKHHDPTVKHEERMMQGRDRHHRPGRVPHRGGPPKPNLAEKILGPASKGQLAEEAGVNKHTSGIPKLLHRKGVGHQVHDAEQLVSARPLGQRRSGRANVRGEMSVVKGDLGAAEVDRFAVSVPRSSPERTRGYNQRSRYLQASNPTLEYNRNLAKVHEFLSINHYAYNVDNQDDDGYNSDADLEPVCGPDDPDWMDIDNHEHVRKVDDKYIFDLDAQIELTPEEQAASVRDSRFVRRDVAPGDVKPWENSFEYEWYFRDITDLDNELLIKPSKPKSNAMLPLRPHGPRIEDFLEAAHDHPSKYMTMEKRAIHPDSKREPRPIFPKGRKPPDEKFVNGYKGFLYVSGLVPEIDDVTGEIKDFDDPLHKQSISEVVAKLFGINSLDVAPASPTSAFVGFSSKLDAKNAMINCQSSLGVKHPTKIDRYVEAPEDKISEAERNFVARASGPDSILKVTGLPPGSTSIELLQTLFPPGTKLDVMFGPLDEDDYLRISPTTALINLASADLVSKALKSNGIANNAAVLGQRYIQVLRAKRERVFDGWTGFLKAYGKSKLGNRLIVTGEVPPHDLFLSHHDLMHISGLPQNVTLDDLATFFQPFSSDRRDVYGSAHIVRCSRGIPTGSAYVGFELPGEIDEVKKIYDGKATISGCEVILTPVQDKLLLRGKREGARPARSLEELNDDLTNWQKHVDPKDIKELEALGVDKSILDEALITLRQNNRSFAGIDQAMPGERLYEQRPVGHHYRDVVRLYIKLLKECAGSKEDPGLMYKAMFSPDQPLDLSIFEYEAERVEALRKRGV